MKKTILRYDKEFALVYSNVSKGRYVDVGTLIFSDLEGVPAIINITYFYSHESKHLEVTRSEMIIQKSIMQDIIDDKWEGMDDEHISSEPTVSAIS